MKIKGSICAYKRGERYFTSYHWCNECPPVSEYRAMERQQKLDWTNANKKRNETWKIKNVRRIKHDKSLADKGF
jgi:hypothetical protein